MNIGIIMDGNRRWAKQNNHSLLHAYNEGARVLSEICITASENSVKTLTVFAFSLENMHRPQVEKNIINQVLKEALDNKFHFLLENDIKFKMIGDKSFFDSATLLKIDHLENLSASCKKMILNVCFYYTGQWEIINAISGIENKQKITIEDLSKSLLIPELDICIRVSGENRISNFALWQISYAEFFFSQTLWPDFSSQELLDIVHQYQLRNRRFGK